MRKPGLGITMFRVPRNLVVKYAHGFRKEPHRSAKPIAPALGLTSRIAAFGVGTTISVAALTMALPNGFFMNWFGNQKGEGFEYHLLMLAISIPLVIQGGGKWALDTLIYRKLSNRTPEESVPHRTQTNPVTAN